MWYQNDFRCVIPFVGTLLKKWTSPPALDTPISTVMLVEGSSYFKDSVDRKATVLAMALVSQTLGEWTKLLCRDLCNEQVSQVFVE